MRTLRHALATLAIVGALSVDRTHADPPATSDPNGRLIAGFDAPGQFPTGVTAANVNIQPQSGAEFDGAGEDVLRIQFPAAGPIKWTSSRANSGDTALSIGPAQPANAFSYPENGFVDNFQAMNANADPINPNSTDLTTLAWRVSNVTGALFASTRHNGVNDGYLTGGAPVGTIYGTSYFAITGAQGWGFRMTDGEFQNGGNGSSDLVTGAVGSGGGLHEASFNVATSYFSYEQGWQGAWVQEYPGVDGEATFDSAAPNLLPSTVNWTNGTAAIALPGVNSASDGMLFVAPSDGGSQTRLAAAFPNGNGGWTANVRFDEDADTTGQTILTSGSRFQFLYVPYDAENLIGGHVAGATGNPINSAGDAQFDMARTASGNYALTVYEADGVTKKDENDGMLILSVADDMPGNPTLADRTFLSYQYDSGNGNFIIQSRELLAVFSGSDDAFGNDFELRDSDFYFAWVDFANPLSLATTPGDFDGDGDVDGDDLADWQDSFGVDDGADADSDGDSDGADFLVWQQNLGTGLPGGPAAVVPEPGSFAMIFLAAAALAAAKRIG